MRVWLVVLLGAALIGCAQLDPKQPEKALANSFVFKPNSQWRLQLGNYVTAGELVPENQETEHQAPEKQGRMWRFLSLPTPSQTEVVFGAEGIQQIIRLDGRDLKLSLVKKMNDQDTNKKKEQQIITVLLNGLIHSHYECYSWQQQYQGRWQVRTQHCPVSIPVSGTASNAQPAHTNQITYNGLTQWVPFINQILELEPIN